MMLLIVTTIPTFGMINEYQFISNDINLDDGYVPGEFLVKFSESPISNQMVYNLNEEYDIISIEELFSDAENTPLDNIYKIYVSEDTDIESIILQYESLDIVEYATPNYIVKIDLLPRQYTLPISSENVEKTTITTPNDPGFSQQWSLENTGQYNGTVDADIDSIEAWDIDTGSEDIIIAIVDTGVDFNHPDLIDNIWINEDEIPDNGIDDDNNGYVDDIHGFNFVYLKKTDLPIDDNGHGTFCAGIASAVTNNEIGMSGVSWNSKIMCVKILGNNTVWTTETYTNAIKYAVDNGADILSMSYGHQDHPVYKSVFDYAYENNAILISAAGNSNTSNTRYSYPSAYENVIRVAATNQRDERCSPDDWGLDDFGNPLGSDFGEGIDVAAPGNCFYSTMPTYQVFMNYQYGFNHNYYLDPKGGTSWAAPTVAGIAALLLSQDPTLTNDEVRKIIRANVDPYISDEYIGTGRVNAYKALTRYNTQPEIPDTPSGRTNGKPGREYTFTTTATDEDGDDLWYFWDWGDGNYSEWLGPYASGEECEASYIWQQEANFTIKVKVKDGKGGESYWSEEFIFSTPKNMIKTSTDIFWSDNFDSYDLGEILGDNPNEDGGWEIWDDGINNPRPSGGEVVDYIYRSSPHSLEIFGPCDILHQFDGLNCGNVTCSVWSYVPNEVNYGAVTVFGSYHKQGTSVDPLTPVGVQFDNVEGVIFNVYYHNYLPIITDQWVEIRLELNLEEDWYECYYNNELLVEGIWTVTTHGDAYRNFGFLDFFLGTNPVLFDDITVEWESTGLEPDLDGEGSLQWTDVEVETIVTGSFSLENIGDPNSWLEWRVDEYPDFGTWYCNPAKGLLKTEDGPITVEVRVKAPENKNKQFTGDLKIEVIGNPNDEVIIPVTLTTPKIMQFNEFNPWISRIIERFPILESLF